MKKTKRFLSRFIIIAVLMSCSACAKSETKKEVVSDSADVKSTEVNSTDENSTSTDSTSANNSEPAKEEASKSETLGEDTELTVYPLYLESLEQSEDEKYFAAETEDYAIMYFSNKGSDGTSYNMKLYSFDENGDCVDLVIKEIYPSEKTMQYVLSNESNYSNASEGGFTMSDFDGADSSVKNCIFTSDTVIYKHPKEHEIPSAKEQLIADLQSYIDTAPMASYTDYATDPQGGAFSSEDSEFGFWFSKEVLKGNFFNNKGEGPNR